jgi:hypothetical protein
MHKRIRGYPIQFEKRLREEHKSDLVRMSKEKWIYEYDKVHEKHEEQLPKRFDVGEQ